MRVEQIGDCTLYLGDAREVLPGVRGVDPVKLNNNYTSRYVRLFEARNPGLRGRFRTRRLSPETLDSTSTVPAGECYRGAAE